MSDKEDRVNERLSKVEDTLSEFMIDTVRTLTRISTKLTIYIALIVTIGTGLVGMAMIAINTLLRYYFP